jgi:protein-S-isoprenylcysteine O-methyltransferase
LPIARRQRISKKITMKMPLPAFLGIIMGLSEMLLSIFKRSGKNAVSKDRHSLGLIWLVTLTAIAAGIVAAYKLYWCRLPWPETWVTVSCWLFAVGLALRWYAILYLGRFFTTNVAIAADHCVVDTGPYRFVRHPSYAGAMLALLGLSLSFLNWASALIIFIPCFAVNQWRIRIEEKALAEALGETYLKYMQRTKRLIPFIF